MLFGVVTGPTFLEAKASLEQALQQVQGVELRFDLFDSIDIEEISTLIEPYRQLKLLFTLRPARQGGQFQGSEELRLMQLKKLCALQPNYVDLEYDIPQDYFQEMTQQFPNIKLICSYHDFNCMPEDLSSLLAKISNPYAQITKIAVTAKTSSDALAMVQFVRAHGHTRKLIGICMQEIGSISRVLGPVAGNAFDYASLPNPMAPGQLCATSMQYPYRHHQLNQQTALYGLIGYPVEKSIGHLVHNDFFQRSNTNAVYVKMPVSPQELAEFVQIARQLPFKGFSVTMPLKTKILPFLDSLTPAAQKIGAVNTIEIKNGKWIGHNTDGIGALDAIESHTPVKNKRLVLLGAGGAARAILYEAIQRGAQVTVLNRTASKALDLARVFPCTAGGFDLFPQILSQGYDILVNTIPEGEGIDESWILPHTVVMDIVYNTPASPWLLQAAQKGCHRIHGKAMFFNQAAEQQKIWSQSL